MRDEECEVLRLIQQGLVEAATGDLVDDEEVWSAVEAVLARHGSE